MAKYYGKIGYAEETEIRPGVYKNQFTERSYYGDLNRSHSRNQNSDKLNDDIVIANELSIIADPFAYDNFYAIKYAEVMGVKLKVTSVEVNYPRLILQLGGKYNGEQT